MDNKKWFKEAQFGMMIHWGLYTLPAGEWKGKRMTGIGEWIQQYYRIPNAEYHELAKAFNPVLFNAEDWDVSYTHLEKVCLEITGTGRIGGCHRPRA